MSTSGIVALVAIALVGVASAFIGSLGVRVARSTSDFLVASRTVGPVANASAISGEYLSAASFLGVAGMILRDGADALWFPIAFTTGYLALRALRRGAAAPLGRVHGARLRRRPAELATACAGCARSSCSIIGWLYLLPQLQGAGLALTTLTALPAWSGIAGAGLVVVLTVVGGGMRSITFVQAFQFWLKLTALAVPAVFVLGLFLSDSREPASAPPPPTSAPRPPSTSTPTSSCRLAEPVNLAVDGTVDGRPRRRAGDVGAGPARGRRRDAAAVPGGLAGARRSPARRPRTGAGSSRGPATPTTRCWPSTRCSSPASLGTMGLPHVLVRFYTNPDGRAARRTTVAVLAMIGGFYIVAVLRRGARPALHAGAARQRRDRRRGAAGALAPRSAAAGRRWLLGGLVAAGTRRRRSCRRRPGWS